MSAPSMQTTPVNTTPVRATRRTAAAPTTARRWRSITVHPLVYAVLVLAVFLGIIQAARMTPSWSTSAKVNASGQKITATGANPAEIKGWMKISEILPAYGLTQEEFYSRFKIPAEVSVDSQLKDLEKVTPYFSVTALRNWLMDRSASK